MDFERPVSSNVPRRAGVQLRRFVPLGVVVIAMVAVFASGAHRHVSLETLVRHRMAIEAFIDAHMIAAVAAFMALYIVAVALSIPGSIFLTIASGILFGTVIGGAVSAISATTGATIIFLVAKSACGETLVRRAGPLACKLADGFRADAFSYLLFLRLVPAFPFFLVNLVPALAGVRLGPFVAATALGVIPASVVYTLAGTGLDSVLTAEMNLYNECVAAGRTDCAMSFEARMILTPQLVGALVALALLALVPVVMKRW